MVKRPGFTLIEVLVAITLLSVGVLGLAASGAFAAALLRSAQSEEAATALAATLLDSLVHAPALGAGELTRGPLHAEWLAAGAVVSLTVSYADPPGTRRHQWQAHALRDLDRLAQRAPALP